MSLARRGLAVGLAACGLVCTTARAETEVTGVVFVDDDRDGVQDASERGQPGVLVSNGLDLTRTDEAGRYTLPRPGDFVWITRPAGFDGERWYATGGGDFALVPRAEEDLLFFIHFSDAHVFDRMSDFEDYSSPGMPWFIPDFAADYVVAWMLARTYDRVHDEGFAERLRAGLAASSKDDLGDLSGAALLARLREEMARPGSEFGDVAGAARRSIAEIGALAPDFVISTGDMVLEGNQATPEAVARWFTFYRDLVDTLPMPVYNTIGNNEIAGIGRADWAPDHPRYGRVDYHAALGPSHYSFDRGAFHFVALDTHRPAPRDDAPEWWRFDRMEPDVAAWAASDLAAHPDKVLVVLNHEPFHWDDDWPFERRLEPGADGGLFDAHGVDYVLSGHTHWNSHFREGDRHHITTGALSGMRWVLPASVHPRGYRLFIARDGKLYSAWKETGKPVIARVEPALEAEDDLLFVAADVSGPFAVVEAWVDGEVVPIEAWGRYYFRMAVGSGASATIRATRADGSEVEVDVPLRDVSL